VAQVRCSAHGVFTYKTSACPGCANEARQRYEQLVTELGDEAAQARDNARLFGKDRVCVPLSAAALARLRAENAAGAESVAAEFQRARSDFERRQLEREQINAGLAELKKTHGVEHRLGSRGSTCRGRLLGAADIGAKRYARIRNGPLGSETVCVPWIDAFAERVGQNITVQWLNTEHGAEFRVSDRDGAIEDGL